MEQRISIVTLGVADLNRSRDFYLRLGWKPAVKGADGVAFFQVGGLALALYPRSDLATDATISLEGGGFHGVSLAQNMRSRGEVDATLAEAKMAGATILKTGQDTSWGGYSGHFADPDGFLWEVAWNPGFPIAADGTIQLPD